MKEIQFKWIFDAVSRSWAISETGTKYRIMVLQWHSAIEDEKPEFYGNLHFESIDGKWEKRITPTTKCTFNFSKSDLEEMWKGKIVILEMEEIE